MTADGGAGTLRLAMAQGRDGRRWELQGRVEPVPGCAADVIPGYRLTLLARPLGEEGGSEVLRVSPSTVYPGWAEAVAALRLLAAEVAAAFAREGAARSP